jgi:RecJ-like exonuclease
MEGELCRMCGGDGRIGNALGGSSATCPSCHGSGRRAEMSPGFHDVTKTKPSHHRPAVAVSTGPKSPTTPEGVQLAREVSACTGMAEDAKTRLVAEIMNHESTHGRCTKTFIKKVRKQTRLGQ